MLDSDIDAAAQNWSKESRLMKEFPNTKWIQRVEPGETQHILVPKCTAKWDVLL